MSGGSMEQTTTGLGRRRLLATLGSAAVAGAALGGVEALRPGADSMARASTVVPTGTSPYGFNVIDYGAVPNRSVDSSAAFQAAALAASNAGGGEVLVPHGYYNAMWDLYPGVVFVGEGRGATYIYAPPGVGPSRPIVGSGGRDCFYHGLKSLPLVGSVIALKSNKGERGIELISTNGDTLVNSPGGAGHPNDAAPIIEDVFVHGTGGLAVYFGTNMRGGWIDKLNVLNCQGGGLLVKASDASFANLYIGGNTGGPNIEVYGSVNHFVNCKSFWGDPNWKIEGYDVTLDSCESQDSSGYGLDVMFGSVVAKSFVSNGDLRACRVSGAVDGYNGGYNDIDMSVCAADRYLSV